MDLHARPLWGVGGCFVFEQLIDIIDWQLDEEKYQDLNVEDFEEIKRLVMKSITENIYKRL